MKDEIGYAPSPIAFTIDTRIFGGGTEGPHVLTIDPATAAATVVGDLNFPAIAGAVRFNGVQGGQCKKR